MEKTSEGLVELGVHAKADKDKEDDEEAAK